MKTKTCTIAILIAAGLLAAGLTNSRAQNTWTQKADFGGVARQVAAGFSIGSKGYIGTGLSQTQIGYQKDFWEYTPAAAQTPGTWTATGSMSTARYLSTATLLNNGKILVT